MKKNVIVLCSLLIAAPLMAAPPTPPPAPRQAAAEDTQPLPRPVKIAFRFEPKEPQDKTLWLLASTTRYSIALNFEGKGGEYSMKVAGRIHPIENRFLFTYDAEIHFVNADGSAFLGTEGSTQLVPGKEKVVANFGDRSLVVLVTYEDEK